MRRREESDTTPSPMALPTMSRSSSSSSSFVEPNDGSMDVISLLPLTSHAEDGHHHPPRAPEQSLRQRSTTSGAPSQLSAAMVTPRDEDESLSNSDEDEPKSGNSIFRSVLGASPFLMGPHIFSPSEMLQPPRERKESDDTDNVQRNFEMSPLKKSVLFRRGASRSPSTASTSSSTVGSPFSDASGGEQNYSLDDGVASMVPSSIRKKQLSNSYQKGFAFVLRTRENVIIHFLMELKMFQTEILFILFTTCFQFFHSAVTNVAYLQHAQLNAANRVPLKDLAFEMLPALDGDLWVISEYFFLVIVGVCVSCIASNLIVKWNAPHGRPIYSVQILRRMGMTLCICQVLRMISFLVTTLPGASRQCRYTVPDGLTSEEMVNGPAPEEGNPIGYGPPKNLNDVLFRVDATNGCGDLMFSSHTIYTMTFVCIVFKYFNFKWLKVIMALGQIGIVPFILAARKHYSVDVFTALYVTPLVFEILWTRFPDRDTSIDMAKYYGMRFYLAQGDHDSYSYVVSMWGREFYVDPDQLPLDIGQGHHHVKGLALEWSKDGENSGASIV